MKNGKPALVLFSMMTCVVWFSLISDVAYSQGYDNATVLKVQEELQALGYNPGPLDGMWGKKTKRALQKFQYESGLSITGKLDLATKEKLGLITSDKDVAEPNVTKDVVEPTVTEDIAEPAVTRDIQAPTVTKDAAEPSVPKEVLEPTVPVVTVQNGIQEALQANFEIKTVRIKNGVLTVAPVSDVVTKDGYAALIPRVCEEIAKYPHTFNRLKEIRVLNASENQGWVLLRPKQCTRITNAPSTDRDEVIFRQSADVLIFTSGQR
jgi:peptidoglycan hydrolase-like protein with peptidoglycan-binding domain